MVTRKKKKPRKAYGVPTLAVLPPKPSRQITLTADVPTALIDQAIQSFADVIGGRDTLQAELAIAPDLSPELQTVRLLLADPRHDRASLGDICRKSGVAPCDLFKAFRDAAIAKANLEALTAVARRLPEITADVLSQAVAREETCPRCHGTGTISKGKDPVPCAPCRQSGTIHVPGSLEHQRLALELTGLLHKSGFSFAQQIVVPQPAGNGSFGSLEQLQQAVAGVLSGHISVPESIDADLLEDP